MAEQCTKQKMCSRVVAMSHIHDDKSAPKEYYKNGDEHCHDVSCDHINPGAPISGHCYDLPSNRTSIIATGEKHGSETIQQPTPAVSSSLPARNHTSPPLKSGVPKMKSIRRLPKRIALCGGGVRGIAHVGVMKSLQEENMLRCLKEVIGISAGSLFALLWVLEYSVAEIEKLSLEFDFSLLSNIDPENILLFTERYGIDSGVGIDKLISSILRQKGHSPDITFQELAIKHPLRLRCFASELQTSRIKDFSSLKTPNVKVRVAIRASMAVPLFYTPVEDPETGSLLVDGGLLHNLPLVFMNEEESKETIGVLFQTSEKSIFSNNGKKGIGSIMEYINCLFDGVVMMRNIPYLEKYKNQVICIPTDNFESMDFSPKVDGDSRFSISAEQNKEKKKNLIEYAKKVTKDFLFSSPFSYLSEKPSRRFSVC